MRLYFGENVEGVIPSDEGKMCLDEGGRQLLATIQTASGASIEAASLTPHFDHDVPMPDLFQDGLVDEDEDEPLPEQATNFIHALSTLRW